MVQELALCNTKHCSCTPISSESDPFPRREDTDFEPQSHLLTNVELNILSKWAWVQVYFATHSEA